MLIRSVVRSALAGLLIVATSLPAAAHVGHGETDGFIHGFMHPIGGLDHMLAMVSVGMLAALLGGRALWMVPVSFMAMMAVGAALAMSGFDLPFVELGISLSVIALGVAVALQLPLPMIGAMAFVGFFAVFHGFAHGAEMPVDQFERPPLEGLGVVRRRGGFPAGDWPGRRHGEEQRCQRGGAEHGTAPAIGITEVSMLPDPPRHSPVPGGIRR